MEAFYRKSEKDDYIRVLKWEKIDACKLVADIDSYTLLREQVDKANETFKGMIHKCPYKEFHIEGVTISFTSRSANNKPVSMFPSGYIKVNLIFRNRNKFLGFVEYSFEQNFV